MVGSVEPFNFPIKYAKPIQMKTVAMLEGGNDELIIYKLFSYGFEMD